MLNKIQMNQESMFTSRIDHIMTNKGRFSNLSYDLGPKAPYKCYFKILSSER